ncbi:hypothetical protein [Desulfosporosinus sp. FKA]|uniref:hypothetical protein n=1 Tax=Desulfosporosinus sp. FKA TaxID=1969834 RepID=UPI000B49F918|nr:hypothetical protein [Desulfosporosinus sp. FKA]
MAIGDNRFNVSRLALAFNENATLVTVTLSKADEAVPRDKFGKPTDSPNTTTISIVVSKAELDISAVVAGGKPKEVLEFYALLGTISENDELTWNGHTFRTSSAWPFGLGSQQQLLFCKAEREVDR